MGSGILDRRERSAPISAENQLHYHRMAVDGAPFRGQAPEMTEDEYQRKTHTVNDAHVAVFDMDDGAHRSQLEEILSNAYNGNWQIYKMIETPAPQTNGSVKMFIYCAWVMQFREEIT